MDRYILAAIGGFPIGLVAGIVGHDLGWSIPLILAIAGLGGLTWSVGVLFVAGRVWGQQ